MSHVVLELTPEECTDRGRRALAPFSDRGPFEAIKVYAVPRGGMCALVHLMSDKTFPFVLRSVPTPELADVILDDIIDSGKTRERILAKHGDRPFVAIIDKVYEGAIGWVRFPWEHETGPEDAVVRLIEAIGEDPSREGLLKTPQRVVKALREMTVGYGQSPEQILSTVFDEKGCDEIVLSRGIPFVSLCEHHLLNFTGVASVGYLPNGKVVGLSKLARLVDCFAKRLSMQERLTSQIANALMEHLNARGAAVVIKAQHSCMSCRGVSKTGAEMVTSVALGVFREDPKARAEFMSLLTV